MNLISKAQAWMDQDPDPQTRSELSELIGLGNTAELESRFAGRLEFGTAGLRGELGAGPNRMNRVVVAQAAFAIAQFLKNSGDTYLDSEGKLSAVIGYDARVNSDIFARDTAEIFQAAGITAKLFSLAVPTPVAAFTGKRLSASATIVVTASHNPPRDNGYKVYLGGPNGSSQLISPQDGEIAALIEKIALETTFAAIPKSSDYQILGQSEVDGYISRAAELVMHQRSGRGELGITYTALHGVGYDVVAKLFARVGFHIDSVTEQQAPDGSFPTVKFPNPEEPGAMDLSFELAKKLQSDIIIANDPDADRLAVGIRTDSGYQMLTGDQVGLLLAEATVSSGKKGTVAHSIVSASLAPLAKHFGVEYRQTLTGFKWISKVPNLSYGYEEALGYCVDPSHTPDKDGISAALIIAELAAELKQQGRNLKDLLAELAERYGHLATGQVSIRVSDLSVISKIMAGIRANPPVKVLGAEIGFEDLESGNRFPPTNGVILESDQIRVIIRPSGTEPKLKCYLQATADSAKSAEALLGNLKVWASELLASHQ